MLEMLLYDLRLHQRVTRQQKHTNLLLLLWHRSHSGRHVVHLWGPEGRTIVVEWRSESNLATPNRASQLSGCLLRLEKSASVSDKSARFYSWCSVSKCIYRGT